MEPSEEARIGYPRFFNIGGYWLNSYKLFLIIGIYVGSIVSAGLGEMAGRSPLRVGLAAAVSALLGLIGARLYHVLIHARMFFSPESRYLLWDTHRGGWGVFGALITFAPASYVSAAMLGDSPTLLWDFMSGGVLAGGFWIRFGCAFNGCCVGRPTDGLWPVRLHDIDLQYKSRVPVQYLEMAWWLLGCVMFMLIWPRSLPPGSYALGVMAWYGVGRFFLEPLREDPEIVLGRIPINQVMAAGIAAGAGGVLVWRLVG